MTENESTTAGFMRPKTEPGTREPTLSKGPGPASSRAGQRCSVSARSHDNGTRTSSLTGLGRSSRPGVRPENPFMRRSSWR